MQKMTWPKRVCATFISLVMALAIVPVLPGGAQQAQAASPVTITQTGATENSVTFTWPKQSGITNWVVTYYLYKDGASSASQKLEPTDAEASLNDTTNVAAVFSAVTDVRVSVTVSGYQSGKLMCTSNYCSLYTLPTKTGKPQLFASPFTKDASSLYKSYRLSVKFEKNSSSSDIKYQGELYNAKGKLVQRVTLTSYASYIKFSKATYKNMYRVRVRPYITLANTSTKAYGAWSSWLYVAPSVSMKAKKKDLKNSSYKISWTRITGATKYVVYVAKSKKYKTSSSLSKKSFKKAATVSAKKSSYTVKKVGKQKVNTKKYYYYTYVVAKGKVSGKSVTSKPYNYYSVHRY